MENIDLYEKNRTQWCKLKLGEIVSYKKGYAFKSENYKSTGVRVIKISDTTESSIKSDNITCIDVEKYNEYKEWTLSENDVIISTVGSRPPLYDSMVGKVVKVPLSCNNALLNQNMVRLRTKENVNQQYLYYLLKTRRYLNHIENICRGNANQVSITLDELFDYKIDVPPLKEQEKIAEILSTWDSAIEKQEQLIEKKKEFKKGLMQVLYSKGTKKEKLVKSKLGEVPESWNIIKAKEVFKSVSIKNNQNEELLSVTQDKGTIPRSQLEGNVVMPEGSTNGYKLVLPNNFIISLRSFQGGLEISRHRGIISPAYTVLENKIDICHDYFKYYFKKEDFISRLNGAIVGIRDGKQISYADFGEMFLPVPPIEEQRKIAEILALADKEIELLQKELEGLKLQKKGLMQRLLTGEVRVKV